MSRYKITKYRGCEISYNDHTDKFECVIAEHTRTSGAIDKLKKVIDQWVDELRPKRTAPTNALDQTAVKAFKEKWGK